MHAVIKSMIEQREREIYLLSFPSIEVRTSMAIYRLERLTGLENLEVPAGVGPTVDPKKEGRIQGR